MRNNFMSIWNCVTEFSCIDDNGQYSRDDIEKEVRVLYTMLAAICKKPKQRVIYLANNSHRTVAVIIAAMKSNCILVPVSKNTPANKLLDYLEFVNGYVIIMEEEDYKQEEVNRIAQYANIIFYNKKKIEILHMNEKREHLMAKKNVRFSEYEDIAFIMFTSGTVGRFKAAIYTYKKILSMLEAIYEYMAPRKEDIFFCMKQPQHVSVWIGEILMCIYAHATLSIRKSSLLHPRKCIDNIVIDKASILFTNPNILNSLIRVKCNPLVLENVHSVYVSGSPMDENVHRKADYYFKNAGVYNIYGLTEAGPRVCAQNKMQEMVYGSVGRPLRDVSVFIEKYNINTNHYETIKEPRVIGEVFVQSPYVIPGYWPDIKMEEKKLKTGDLGYFDEDGAYYVVGRSDDMILYESHIINPITVEYYMCCFSPIIASVVFAGKKRSGKDKIIALYRTDKNVDINETHLYELLRNNLEQYECPSEVYRVERDFISPNGKIKRNEAKKYYEEFLAK